MALSAFGEKAHAPTDDDLREVLGRAYSAWNKLIAAADERIGPIDEVWAFTSASTGWGLRLRHKDRVIFYMTPQEGEFLASFVLGEKAVAAVLASRPPVAIRDAIAAAPRYAEGRGIRMIVKSVRQISGLVALAQIKKDS